MMSEHSPQQVLHDPAPGIPAEDVAAVHAYAGAFCGRPDAAARLAAEVLAGQQGSAMRTALLADVRRTAFGWLGDGRSGLLRPGFRDWARWAGETFGTADTLRRLEHNALLLRTFTELADQPRIALWLCLAEGEPAFAARVLNTSEEFAASMAESARSRLADTFLRLRTEHTADARCVHYGGMLGAIARGTHRETPPDLEQHLETCEFCTHDMALLRTLTSGEAQELRALLVDRLLVWGGPSYRAAKPLTPTRTDERRPTTPEKVPPTVPGASMERGPRARPGRWARVAVRVRGGRGSGPDPATKAAGGTVGSVSVSVESPPSAAAPQAWPGAAGTTGPGQSVPDAPALPLSTVPAPRRPVLAIAVAVVVTAVATTVALNLWSGTQTGTAVDSYGPPYRARSPIPSAPVSASASPDAGTVLATVALQSTGSPGRCVTAGAGDSPDNIPASAACDEGAAQRWRVVDIGGGAVGLQHVASTLCLDIAGYRALGDPMQMRRCAYQQGDRAPYPEDQAFVLRTHQDKSFTLVCQDNPAIAVGISNGEIRMLSTATAGRAIRFALDDALDRALGN